MAAPTPSVPGTPTGHKLGDGYQTRVAFAGNLTISFWEKAVTAPGVDGGAEIDTTTMHNVHWRTMAPRTLVTMTAFSMTVGWDPALYTAILAMLNVPTTVTVVFPDGSSICFFGYLKSFKPGSMEEGKFPEATIEVSPTNTDPTTCAEEAPVFTAGIGTYTHC